MALDPGDFFLFFTDGLSEAMNPGAELFGEGRLRRILEDEPADSPARSSRRGSSRRCAASWATPTPTTT